MARSFTTNAISSLQKLYSAKQKCYQIFLLVLVSTGFAMMGRNHSIAEDFMEYRVSSGQLT